LFLASYLLEIIFQKSCGVMTFLNFLLALFNHGGESREIILKIIGLVKVIGFLKLFFVLGLFLSYLCGLVLLCGLFKLLFCFLE
jgi:hypothetical protein